MVVGAPAPSSSRSRNPCAWVQTVRASDRDPAPFPARSGASPRGTADAPRREVAHLANLEPEFAPKKVVNLYHDFQTRMGFPTLPNFIKTQGASSSAASCRAR